MTTQKTEIIYDNFPSFIKSWAEKGTESARANYATLHDTVIKKYIVQRLLAVSKALGNMPVEIGEVCQVTGVFRKNAADNRAFNRDALNEFLESLRNCRNPSGRATIKTRNYYGTEDNVRYFVEPDALNRLLTPPQAAVQSGGGLDVSGRPLPPEKPAGTRLAELYDADIYSSEFNVSRAHYERYASVLAKYERGSYKSTLKAKKLVDSNGASWKLPVAITHMDHILQGVINLGVQEYLNSDSLALLNKLITQECFVLAGKKRGLGSEVQRYLACILPSLQLKSVGDGDSRRFQFSKRKGYDRALFIYDVESKLENGKRPTTPLISLRNFFILEAELKQLRRIQSAKNAERYSESLKIYEERLAEFERLLAEQAAKQ